MKKVDSWSSQYRKKKFYKNQEEKIRKQTILEKKFESLINRLTEFEKQYRLEECQFSIFNNSNSKINFDTSQSIQENSDNLSNLKHNTLKTIAVLLDLDGTSDFIDDKKASIFIQQLDNIRKKFGAEIGTISISTHYDNSVRMKSVLDVLARNLSENIKIGLNFYYEGIYDYDLKLDIPQEFNFNSNKVRTFDKHYINNFDLDNQWFAIIDDGISEDTYRKYQHNHPMLLCRPSQYELGINNNFMSIATMTKGFDGVIEIMDIYLNSIKDLSPSQILEKQKEIMTHISGHELMSKIFDKKYEFVEKYFQEGYADNDDYRAALIWIYSKAEVEKFTKEELQYLKNILKLLIDKFAEKEEQIYVEQTKKLYKILGI